MICGGEGGRDGWRGGDDIEAEFYKSYHEIIKFSREPLVVKVASLGEVTPRYHQEGLGAHPEEGAHRPGVGDHLEVVDHHRVGEGHHQEAEGHLELSNRHIRE